MSSYLSVPPPERTWSPLQFAGNRLFCYGTNLWIEQVKRRCPGAKLIGLGRLRNYTWQINDQGLCNIIPLNAAVEQNDQLAQWLAPLGGLQVPSSERVYGMVWLLSDEDMAIFDQYQVLTPTYQKHEMIVEFWDLPREDQLEFINVKSRLPRRMRMSVYYDSAYTSRMQTPCEPALAYKIQQGVESLVALGAPKTYVDNCIRPFLPQETDTTSVMKQFLVFCVRHGLNVRQLLNQVESDLIDDKADTVMWNQVTMPSLIAAFNADSYPSPPESDTCRPETPNTNTSTNTSTNIVANPLSPSTTKAF